MISRKIPLFFAGALYGLAAGSMAAPSAVQDSRKFPTEYPKEWNVQFHQRKPIKIGEGFCQPHVPGVASGLCYGKYIGLKPEKTVFSKGTKLFPSTPPLACDIERNQDVAITLRDGAKIYVDVFRPVGEEKLPAILAWSPYTKSTPQDPTWVYPNGLVEPSWVSGLGMFEGPDPGYWSCKGYTVINADPRGFDSSEGNMHYFGMVDAADGYEVVEWAGTQPWSNGKVGMSGSSWLAMTQYFIAAMRPPHLAAIAPESPHISDLYRHRLLKGGIPNIRLNKLLTLSMQGRNLFEAPYEMAEKYPLMNPYWEDKIPNFKNIDIPLYLVGGYGTEVQAAEMDGFPQVSSKEKWLRISDKGTWTDEYTPSNVEDLRQFFDRYLRGVDNGWEKTPRVRLALLDPGGSDQLNVPAKDWPLPETKYTHLHLDSSSGALSSGPVGNAASASYDAKTGKTTFQYKFDRDTKVIGYLKLHLWVEVSGANDGDFFVTIQKTDEQGQVLKSQEGYKETGGRLRASLRALDVEKSNQYLPVHSFKKNQFLQAGEIVPMEIAIAPTGMVWRKGQVLHLTIAGDLLKGNTTPQNSGNHIIHTGGKYNSYLQLPLSPENGN